MDYAKPAACASRSTTPVEQRYPQLDLEALAVRCRLWTDALSVNYVGGPPVSVVTDRKPLLGVFGNTRQGSIRSDRIKDVWFEVVWRKGSTNPAFFMSRRGTPLTELPKSWRKEATQFDKTVWLN